MHKAAISQSSVLPVRIRHPRTIQSCQVTYGTRDVDGTVSYANARGERSLFRCMVVAYHAMCGYYRVKMHGLRCYRQATALPGPFRVAEGYIESWKQMERGCIPVLKADVRMSSVPVHSCKASNEHGGNGSTVVLPVSIRAIQGCQVNISHRIWAR